MKIHEYQGKAILKEFGVPVPRGIVARTPEEAEAAARELGTDVVVVKAQIHAGGRGKGGGVKLAKSPEEAKEIASQMLGMHLVTHQTGPEGREVKTLLIGQDLYVQIPGITKAGTWTHVDVSRLPEGANVGLRPGQIDPANTAKLLSSTTDVQQVDARSYKGTLDLTKVAGITGVDKVTVDSWGSAANQVPFTAGLDDQGRLSALTIQLPAANGQPSRPLEVLYTDYGTPVNVQRPAASEIIEAPANVYSSLGG